MGRDEPWYRRYGDLIAPAYGDGDDAAGAGRTAGEVAFIARELLDAPTEARPRRILDVGCGTGRHARALAALGHDVTGLDCSPGLLDVARRLAAPSAGAGVAPGRLWWVEADARDLDMRDEFDVALSLHGGAFGLGRLDADDEAVLRGIARALRPNGLLLLTATAAAGLIAGFVTRAVMTGDDDTAPPFDPAWFVTRTDTVTDPAGTVVRLPAWWRAYTARELTLLCRLNGLRVERLYGSTSQAWEPRPPRLDDAQLLVIARKAAPA